MAKGAGKARKKLPKELAVIRADSCTGCEACIEVCPVDCIYKVEGHDLPSLQSFVDIDLDRCIGCKLCERWWPWDAIDMVPPTEIVDDKDAVRQSRHCAFPRSVQLIVIDNQPVVTLCWNGLLRRIGIRRLRHCGVCNTEDFMDAETFGLEPVVEIARQRAAGEMNLMAGCRQGLCQTGAARDMAAADRGRGIGSK